MKPCLRILSIKSNENSININYNFNLMNQSDEDVVQVRKIILVISSSRLKLQFDLNPWLSYTF